MGYYYAIEGDRGFYCDLEWDMGYYHDIAGDRRYYCDMEADRAIL